MNNLRCFENNTVYLKCDESYLQDPNCTGGIRVDLKCNFVSDDEFDYNDAMNECIDKGFDPISVNETDLQDFPWNLFDNLTMVWVGIANQFPKRAKRNG